MTVFDSEERTVLSYVESLRTFSLYDLLAVAVTRTMYSLPFLCGIYIFMTGSAIVRFCSVGEKKNEESF